MTLDTLFAKKRDELRSLWVDAVLETYPQKSAPFLRTNTDPFTNPMVAMLKEAATGLFDALALNDVDIDQVKASLDRFVKLRAVQDWTASQSMGVFYLLKPLFRKHLLPEIPAKELLSYLDLESRVDTLVLLAFDMYTKDRETVAEIRIKEIRSQYAQLKRWAQQLNAQAPLGTFVGCGKSECTPEKKTT